MTAATPAIDPVSHPGGSLSVVLIEDRKADARLVAHTLESFPDARFEITLFDRLTPASEHLERQIPDIIVADLNLPDSTGLHTFSQLQRVAPTVPLVIMTAQADSELGVRAVDAGAQDYLVKGEVEGQGLGRLLLQAIARQKLRQTMSDRIREAERSHTRMHSLVDLNMDGMLIVDRDGEVIFANRRAEELFGRSKTDLAGLWLGRPIADQTGRLITLVDPDGKTHQVSMRMQATGWDDGDAFMVLLSAVTDATGGIARLGGHSVDNVTGLFSRDMFYEQARLCLQHARAGSLTPALLCVNIDNFRRINEAMGHGSGDELLRLAGTRIRRQLRSGDIVGRFSGDEFLVLLAPLRRAVDADAVADKIMIALSEPIDLWRSDLRVTARAGVSVYPHDGNSVDELVRHAQVAARRAKEAPAQPVQYYTRELGAHSERRFHLEQRLRRALPEEQFDLNYQPIAEVASGRIIGVETLLRWHPDDAEPIGPAEFVPILEETGLISGVGEWVLRGACDQARWWWDQGHELSLAVNISPIQFDSPRLLDVIAAALADTGLPPNALVLELTESVLMRNVEASVITLKALRERGVRVAIDDFGTGFSSLNYLKRFDIDTLKIDRSFTRDVMLGGHDAAITRATIDLAHNLGLRVVAEGVEHEQQLEFMRAHGCDAYQGFLLGRPASAAQLSRQLGAPD